MSDQQYQDGDNEAEEARRRIERIRGGGGGESTPSGGYETENVGSDSLSRARARSRQLGSEPASTGRAGKTSGPQSARGSQAFIVIGGIVAVGLVIVAGIAAISVLNRGGFGGGTGGGLPGLFQPATETPVPTETATSTPEPTLTPTATKEAPALSLPPLTCIFQSGQGCFDYCADDGNRSECNAARDFVEAQGVDPDFFFNCLSPGSGPNEGNPQTCLDDAWRERNP